MKVDVKEAHEILLYFTHFQPSEMMRMTEKEMLYWVERVGKAYKNYRPKQ